jgi:chromosome segregation ATPase
MPSLAKTLTENIGAVSIGSLVASGSLIWGWVKLHKKLISDPIGEISKRLDGLTHKQASDRVSLENRHKELDNFFQYHDERLEKLEKEDNTLIQTINLNSSKLERLQTNFANHEDKYQELKLTLTKLQDLDTQRQVAVGKVQTLLEVFIGKN